MCVRFVPDACWIPLYHDPLLWVSQNHLSSALRQKRPHLLRGECGGTGESTLPESDAAPQVPAPSGSLHNHFCSSVGCLKCAGLAPPMALLYICLDSFMVFSVGLSRTSSMPGRHSSAKPNPFSSEAEGSRVPPSCPSWPSAVILLPQPPE